MTNVNLVHSLDAGQEYDALLLTKKLRGDRPSSEFCPNTSGPRRLPSYDSQSSQFGENMNFASLSIHLDREIATEVRSQTSHFASLIKLARTKPWDGALEEDLPAVQ